MQFDLNRIRKLKQGVTPYGSAPHKPILLLAVLEQFEEGELNLNWIEPSAELMTRFQDIWHLLVSTQHIPTFALPFYHLQGEKNNLWTLIPFPEKKIPLTKSKSIKSYSALVDTVAGAKLDTDFYAALMNPLSREEIKQAIFKTYFPDIHIPEKKANRYSEKIQSEIFYDPAENYARKVKKKFSELKPEEVEQEIVIRSTQFKKAIVQIYKGKCAISGLDIRFAKNVNLVDACHIIPFSESFDDTIRNGIALSPTFHRAFDRGLISISDNYTTLIHKNVKDHSSNYGLQEFHNKTILLPDNSEYYPEQSRLEEHRRRFGF